MRTAHKPKKKITTFHERPIWTAFPSTIALLQQSRKQNQTSKELAESYNSRRGVNATIILLSAACIEGFLVECLKSYTIGNKFASKDTFDGRLAHDLQNRVSTATFGDFQYLFILTLGKPISELISDKELLQGVRTLIDFRNGIAHARSVGYESDALDNDDYTEYYVEQQYKAVHEYLEKKKLAFNDEDFFSGSVADHFAGLLKSYLNAVVELLPVPQSDNVKMLVKFAFKGSIN